VLGHSFGGKVALAYAARAERLRRVWVIDSTPAARQAPEGNAVRMLAALRAESGPFDSREEAERAIQGPGFPASVARWMATNLERTEEGWRWRLDLDGMEALLTDFFETDLWPVVETPPQGLDLHFVKATRSPVLPEEACARIEAAGAATGRVHLHRVEGGHWLNVDAPDAILELMESAERGDTDGHGS
jgi:pimeloyl-ACP methyl ester carboxylesterase